MRHIAANVWKCSRGSLAVMLVVLFTIAALTHTGGHVAPRLPMIGVAVASLAGILIGMWKGRTLEILAWVALLLTLFAAVMS